MPLFYFHDDLGVPVTVLGAMAASVFFASHLKGVTPMAPLIGVATFVLSCLFIYHGEVGMFLDAYVAPNLWVVPLALFGIAVLTYPTAFVLQWFENRGTYQPKRDENGDIIVDPEFERRMSRPAFQPGRRRWRGNPASRGRSTGRISSIPGIP